MNMRHCFYALALIGLLSCHTAKRAELKFLPQEDLFLAKQYPDNVPNLAAMERALVEAKSAAKSGSRTGGAWQQQGPGNIGARINAIAIHPTDENIVLAGFADGGLWRTTDGGGTWAPIFENETVQAIGSICYDPVNPDNIYVGTGDPNISGYPRAGGGIYKSQDKGNTWQYIGLKSANIISNILIPASKPSTIYASAMGVPFYNNKDKGVYKSIDGGATWSQILYINETTGVSDMVLHPTDPDLLYAVGWNRIRNSYTSIVSGPDAKVWRTKDGGQTWDILTTGLPEGNHTRMGIAMAASNPSVLYAQYTDADNLEFKALYKSVDGGDSWSLHTELGQNQLQGSPLGGFGWYFGKIKVNPADENDVFLLGVGLYRYTSESHAWQYVDYTQDGMVDVHADKHDLIIRGNNLYLATDGGLYKTKVNSILEWQDIENIPTTQFYRTAYDPHVPGRYWGGAQDNGTSAGNAISKDSWRRYYGGDGFQMAFHPQDDQIIYAESQRGNIVVSKNGGNSWAGASTGLTGSRHWDMQYIISSHNPDVMYTGTDMIFKNTSGADVDWQPISPLLTDPLSTTLIKQITSVSESPIDERILYCGTSDAQVWVTKDGGLTWENISAGLPQRYISSIKASPTYKSKAYVTMTGYKDNDSTPHLYKTDNAGATWTPISGNLPPLAINDVYIYPNGLDNVLFVATDGGIYITRDSGVQWERLGNNMPLIPVFDLEYDADDNAVIAATFARGIQTYKLSQIGVQLETSTEQIYTSTLEVYPTITDHSVYVKGVAESATVAIYDASGRYLYKSTGSNIDLSELSNGVYILKVAGKSSKVVKI